MATSSKNKNPLPEYVVHGVVESGGYTYVLLVNNTGESIIQRILADNTEIKYAKKDSTTTIDIFWAARVGQSYGRIHEI